MNRFDFYIQTKTDLKQAISNYGFVPFFTNSIPGFSIAEHVARDAWYDSADGSWKVWEWMVTPRR